jgi:hypothetical protein
MIIEQNKPNPNADGAQRFLRLPVPWSGQGTFIINV